MSAPTLLVGLGGTGSEIIQRVYEMATPRQRESISFVVFDTDVNELRAIEERTPKIHTVQTSTSLTVGEYLDVDTYARDHWFPVNRVLNSKALTEGAGQVRAVSRLALNTAIHQGKMSPLNEAIEELYKLKGQKMVQAPRVILAGSLCGGTGSGLILPVALYIRNFMTTKLQQGSAIIRGFFLLPGVFDGVIKTQSERNNLRCNAYAAIREIDSFMMKDDGSLPTKYDLHFMAPRAGSKELDEYTGRPMDFCFLFDSQNLKGMTLNSFAEYKAHAANCIYGMAVAPTSKRSNSSEDNVIREIVFAGGRNRFAGAGSAMLVYPTEDVKKYLALTWTRESITDEWLEIDRRFADEQKTNRNMRRQGYQVAELDRGSHYASVVDMGFEERRPFSSAIRNLCYEFDANGYVEKGSNWTQYLEKLDSYVLDRIAQQRDDLKELVTKIKSLEASGHEQEAKSDTYEDWYQQLLGYKKATIQCTGNLSRNITYSLFKEAKDYTKAEDKFRLEYWLHHNQNVNEFIHPNAVRYFLYNALKELTEKEAEMRAKTRTIENYWMKFEESAFDDPNTEEVETSLGARAEDSGLDTEGKFARFMKRRSISELQNDLCENFGTFYKKTSDYWNAYVLAEIYRSAINYIKTLCNAFHDFYDVLDRNIGKIGKEIEQLELKYQTHEGEALRYVCADQKCLQGLAKDVVNLSSSLELPSDLTCRIFNKMKMYALAEQKPEAEQYFTNAFNETVVSYLEEQIMDHYRSFVDMDIITALEKEAHYHDPETVYELEDERVYAKHVIESAENLAKPFIESPVGKEPRVIEACAYNPELAQADFPGRFGFVASNLKDHGGVEDESIDKNIILFFQSVYDLRANELSKFMPPRNSTSSEKQAGEYYKAYYELIKNIHPETQKSKAITPHIDRWWHVITKLPDLDETSQEEQEERINAAFFWGMLAQYIHFERENASKMVYRPDRNALGLKGDDADTKLIVSNGTPCDHLYEVQDSFVIYPKLVENVLNKINSRIENDLYTKTPMKKSTLFELLKRFRVEEFDFEDENNDWGVRSVFELPLLMKRSVPTQDYYEEAMIKLLDTIFNELHQYMEKFCSKKDFPAQYSELIMDQFQLFLKNVTLEKEKVENVYEDTLFVYICKAIASELEENHMPDKADEVLEVLRKLKK